MTSSNGGGPVAAVTSPEGQTLTAHLAGDGAVVVLIAGGDGSGGRARLSDQEARRWCADLTVRLLGVQEDGVIAGDDLPLSLVGSGRAEDLAGICYWLIARYWRWFDRPELSRAQPGLLKVVDDLSRLALGHDPLIDATVSTGHGRGAGAPPVPSPGRTGPEDGDRAGPPHLA